jgi:SAM-dependent methyltransferase
MPQAYRALQRAVGSSNVRSELVERYALPQSGERVLDIGCGTGEFAEYLGEVTYHGYDPSEEYVEAANEKFRHLGTFEVAGVGSAGFASSSFDLCIAHGVLHHLDDDLARLLFADARRALVSSGRLVTIDPVFDDDQSSVAAFLARRDRGQNVRTAEEYLTLAREHFPDAEVTVRHDLLRVPYSHAIIVATATD